jgi:lipopolysaccharide biosynthesis glycosyltransferase
MIRVFIGYDPQVAVAFSVLAHSIHVRATQPVSITPIMLSQLKAIHKRERNPLQSTEFSFSRFLTPFLSDYSGWSIFMDNDIVVLDDIAKLWDLRDEKYAVQVVKHNYRPTESTKFLDMPQTSYEKKNWSSVILFNNAKCKALTPEYVDTASGLELHQFKWLNDDGLIGEIPMRWNHLVGHHMYNSGSALIHFTEGGPYFKEFSDCEYANDWRRELQSMLHVDQRQNTTSKK